MLVVKVFSYSLESMACKAHCAIAHHGHLSLDDAVKARKQIELLPPVSRTHDAFDIGERYSFLDTVQTIAHGGAGALSEITRTDTENEIVFLLNIPAPAIVNYDVPMRMANDVFDRMVAASREPDFQERAELYAQLDDYVLHMSREAGRKMVSPKTLIRSFLRGRLRDQFGEAAGILLLSLLLPSYERFSEFETSTNTYRDLAQLSYALAAYRADHEQYPKSLDELSEKYIVDIPVDRFSGRSLRYKPVNRGYILYSVGANGKDDDGRRNESQPQADDLAVRHTVE